MRELTVLDSIEKCSGKNDKRDILLVNSNNKKLEQLLDAAFNFHRKYFIHKFNMPKPVLQKVMVDRHDEFMFLLSDLETGNFRGGVGQTMVETFMGNCNALQQRWYSAVLNKDLKAGFSIESANKSGFDIPRFEVMLAKDGKKCKQLPVLLNGGLYASTKLDGYRCHATVIDGDVTLRSRNGKIYENFPTIIAALSQAFPKGKYIFDGEIMSDDFQSMQKTAFDKKGQTVGDVVYHIFEDIPYNEWVSQDFKMKKSKRVELLDKHAKKWENKNLPLEVVDNHRITTMEELQDLEVEFIILGYEGVMIIPDIPYYVGRKSNRLLKMKSMLSQDVEILGFYEGKSKFTGMLGGFVVKQENGLECEVGGGFTDDFRKQVWAKKKKFLGRMFECKYQDLTNHDIMRFPIFMRWRDQGKGSGKI